MAAKLKRIIFNSRAPRRLGGSTLGALNEKLRQANRGLSATGILLYYRQFYFGVLEGDADAVDNAVEGLRQHRDFEQLQISSQSRITERSFETWRLGVAATQIVPSGQSQGIFALQELLPKSSKLRGTAPEVNAQVRKFLASFPTLCGVKRTATGEAILAPENARFAEKNRGDRRLGSSF